MLVKKSDIQFPFEELILALEHEGFKITIESRTRIFDALKLFYGEYSDKPFDLKFILCPIITKNESEQTSFYEIYDRVYNEFYKGLVRKKAINKRAVVLIALLLSILSVLIGSYIFFFSEPKPPITIVPHTKPKQESFSVKPNCNFEITNKNIFINDTVTVKNKSVNEGLKVNYNWSVNADSVNIIDSSQNQIKVIFKKQGTFSLSLKAQSDKCDSINSGKIYVYAYSSRVKLSKAKLLKDNRLDKEYTFLFFTLVFLFLLFISLLIDYLIYRLKMPIISLEQVANYDKEFDLHSNPPFALNMPVQTEKINIDQITGFAKDIQFKNIVTGRSFDIEASIKATIHNYGYPEIIFKDTFYKSGVASKYLILFDIDGSADNQQIKLFSFIVDKLIDHNIYFTKFYYDKDPRKCWNFQFEEGISLNEINKIYSDFVLIVFGNAHFFLSITHGEMKCKNWINDFSAWKGHCFLLTPDPLSSYDYRQVLKSFFQILPASFNNMVSIVKGDISNSEQVQDVLFKNNIEDIRLYLNDDDLFVWICCLAMFEKPSWALTLAIGGALGKHQLTIPNLFNLTRIPWLINEEFPYKVRKELLNKLDNNFKPQKRNVQYALLKILRDLEATIEKKSFANFQRKKLIVQLENQLNPKDKINRKKIYYLIRRGYLTSFEIQRTSVKNLKYVPKYLFSWLIKYIPLSVIILLIIYMLHIFPIKTENKFFSRTMVDSASFYNNKGVNCYNNVKTDSALFFWNKSRLNARVLSKYEYPNRNTLTLIYNYTIDLYNDSKYKEVAKVVLPFLSNDNKGKSEKKLLSSFPIPYSKPFNFYISFTDSFKSEMAYILYLSHFYDKNKQEALNIGFKYIDTSFWNNHPNYPTISEIEKGSLTDIFKDKRDSLPYRIMTIGKNTWFIENLKYLPFLDSGIMVYNFKGNNAVIARETKEYKNWGCLYSFNAAKKYCPDGWHVPTKEDWLDLELTLGMPLSEKDLTWQGGGINIGSMLKSGRSWKHATNSSFFSALPGGYYEKYSNAFYLENENAFFWTSDQYNNYEAWRYRLSNETIKNDSYKFIVKSVNDMNNGYSVRCVKNKD